MVMVLQEWISFFILFCLLVVVLLVIADGVQHGDIFIYILFLFVFCFYSMQVWVTCNVFVHWNIAENQALS